MRDEVNQAIRSFQIGASHSDPEAAVQLVDELGRWMAVWRSILENGGALNDPDTCKIPTTDMILLVQEVYRLRNEAKTARYA